MVLKRQSEPKCISDIIKSLNIQYNVESEVNKQELLTKWKEIAGEKTAKYSYPKALTDKGIMIIVCKNSVVANEIFKNKNEINKKFSEEAEKAGINYFKYIKITYK